MANMLANVSFSGALMVIGMVWAIPATAIAMSLYRTEVNNGKRLDHAYSGDCKVCHDNEIKSN
jgi:hypothetical protein